MAPPAEDQVRSVFLPEYALQGQEFSGHVLWNRSADLVSLSIRLPDGLSLKHIYNVRPDDLAEEQNRVITVSRVKDNGYAGFVLESERFPEPDVTVDVLIETKVSAGGVTSTDSRPFKVNLFRPMLWIENTSRTLSAELQPGDFCLRIKEPIHVMNEGKGTALVLVAPKGVDHSKVTDYLLQDDVRKTHQRVISEGLSKLEGEFHGYESFIGLWKSTFDGLVPQLDEGMLSRLEKLQEASKTVEQDNPELIERIGEVFFDALLAVFTMDQRFKAWAQTMNATLEQGVVILNPSTAVKLTQGESTLDFEVGYIDLLLRPYPPLELKGVVIDSASDGMLPLFELFTTAPIPTGELPGARRALKRGGHAGRRKGG